LKKLLRQVVRLKESSGCFHFPNDPRFMNTLTSNLVVTESI
jgi:hypothetical protein